MKYLAHGVQVEVLAETMDGHFVVHELIDDDESYYGELRIVQKVYDEPPKAKLAEEVKGLRDEIVSLRAEKTEIERQIKKVREDKEGIIRKYEQYEQLKHLNDFIEGKVTHYFIKEWRPKIVERGDKESMCSCRAEAQKLLVLYGKSNGDLEWKLNHYCDGSGYGSEVIPCVSYEEAVEKATQYVAGRATTDDLSKEIIEFAREHGIEIPADALKRWKDKQQEAIRGKIEELKKAIDTKRKELEAVVA